MEKNPITNPMVTVTQTRVGDPTGPRPAGGPAAPLPPGGLPNPKVIVRRTMASWAVAVVVLVLGTLGTVQGISMRKRLYQSETVVVYRPDVVSSEGAPTPDALRSLGAKLKENLFAQSNLTKVIDEFHLYTDVVNKRGYSDAAEVFRKQIVFKARSNDTFAISFQGSTREETQKVTARLAEVLAEENTKARQYRAKEGTEFAKAEKARLDEDLERSEKDLAQFLAEHPEFATEGAGRGLAGGPGPNRRFPMPGGGGKPGPAPPNTPALTGPLTALAVDPLLIAARTQAMNELITARKELSDKSLRFTGQHPDVRVATARVAAAEVALQKAEQAILAAQPAPPPANPVPMPEDPYADSPPKAPIARGPAVPNKAPVDPKAKAGEQRFAELSLEWERLKREVARLRQQQSTLDAKLFNAEISERSAVGGYTATIAILDPAYWPTSPSGTPNKTILLGGLVASLLAGIALAAARGLFLDDRLFDPSEIEDLGLVPVLGVVPKLKPGETKARGIRS
jgi:hypothetical protein